MENATIISKHPKERGSLIPILQDLQEEHGFLSRQGIHDVSDYLGLPESKIYGVATFYNQFTLNPPGRFRFQICRGTACHVKGSFNLLEQLELELGVKAGQTSKDGLYSLETVACLGACSIAPVVTVNGEFHGRLDKAKLRAVVDGVKAAAGTTKEAGNE
jgi:NADH-quinone oxidoreductase subunit E